MLKQAPEERSIQYGDARIVYVLKKHTRAGNKVRVSVSPEGVVSVSAPNSMSEVDILRAIEQRGGWIWQHQQNVEQQRKHVTPRLYVDGECHFYLGRRHMLKIVPKAEVLLEAKRPLVRMLRGKIEVASRFAWSEDKTMQAMRQSEVRELLHRWYAVRAKAVVTARLKILAGSMPWVKKLPEIKFMDMHTRWASCSPKGALTINTHLVKHNHGKQFWTLLTSVRPNWEKDMDYLHAMGEMYLSQ